MALVDPAHPIAERAGALAPSDRFAVREPRQIHPAGDRKTDPLPDPRVHVEEQMLASHGIPDELDLADPVVAERAEDRRTALNDLGDLFADDQAACAEALRILLKLAAHERAADFSVGRDERAERIEPARGHVHELLPHTGKVRHLPREAQELSRVVRAE